MLKKWFDTSTDKNLALLKIRTAVSGSVSLCSAMPIFKYLIWDIKLVIIRSPIYVDSNIDQ